MKEQGVGKLGPSWEGPYQITKVIDQGAHKLQAQNGTTSTTTGTPSILSSITSRLYLNYELSL